VVVVQRQADLFEVVGAAHAGGGLADLLDGGEEEADQDGDDRYHLQQLDQREGAARRADERAGERHRSTSCEMNTR